MSYRAGTRGLAKIGIPDDDAHINCDSCGLRLDLNRFRFGPPLWLLDGKHPPKWDGGKNESGTRWDKCPKCKGAKR